MNMDTLEKEEQRVEVPRKACPVCRRPTHKAVALSETDDPADAKLWFFCMCGVIFQENPHEKTIKDLSYIENHSRIKEYKEVSIHSVRLYAPILEELTYGRKILDVGYCTSNVMDYLRGRGWIAYGIDSNKDVVEDQRIIKDDFETTERLYQKTYDVVWMSQVLENFHQPVLALKKAYDVLQDNGVLYISTADAGFLYTDPKKFPHWNSKENYIIWSRESLCEQLEKIGFEIVYKFRNYHSRFGYYQNLHIIAQKVYY